jgi:hypothetical protein
VLLTRSPVSPDRSPVLPRLACVRRAASVRPEPGSNSPLEICRRGLAAPSLSIRGWKSPPWTTALKGKTRRLATVSVDPGPGNSWSSCPESRVIRPPHFMDTPWRATGSNPKGGVHVHWLLAHCAVFKERDALRPSSSRCGFGHVGPPTAVGFRTTVARGLQASLAVDLLPRPTRTSHPRWWGTHKTTRYALPVQPGFNQSASRQRQPTPSHDRGT